jgi:hypothetical protein
MKTYGRLALFNSMLVLLLSASGVDGSEPVPCSDVHGCILDNATCYFEVGYPDNCNSDDDPCRSGSCFLTTDYPLDNAELCTSVNAQGEHCAWNSKQDNETWGDGTCKKPAKDPRSGSHKEYSVCKCVDPDLGKPPVIKTSYSCAT